MLDVLFTGVLGMGIAGAAWATVISQFLSAILVLRLLLRTDAAYKVELSRLKFNMPILGRILVIGIPSAITGNIVFTAKSQYIDLPLALLVMVGLILPMLLRKKGSRMHGAILVLIYAAYCVYSFVAVGV